MRPCHGSLKVCIEEWICSLKKLSWLHSVYAGCYFSSFQVKQMLRKPCWLIALTKTQPFLTLIYSWHRWISIGYFKVLRYMKCYFTRIMWNNKQDFTFCLFQIHLQQGNYKLAEQSLEVGLSYNFEVNDSRLYRSCSVCCAVLFLLKIIFNQVMSLAFVEDSYV